MKEECEEEKKKVKRRKRITWCRVRRDREVEVGGLGAALPALWCKCAAYSSGRRCPTPPLATCSPDNKIPRKNKPKSIFFCIVCKKNFFHIFFIFIKNIFFKTTWACYTYTHCTHINTHIHNKTKRNLREEKDVIKAWQKRNRQRANRYFF